MDQRDSRAPAGGGGRRRLGLTRGDNAARGRSRTRSRFPCVVHERRTAGGANAGALAYIRRVTPSDYAAEELDLWEQALQEQRGLERELDAARVAWQSGEFFALVREVDTLRTRSDLLLAEAVKVKLLFRDGVTVCGELAGPDTDFDAHVLLSDA